MLSQYSFVFDTATYEGKKLGLAVADGILTFGCMR